MATKFAFTQTADGLVLAVTVKNRGDVPAHAVQFEVTVADRILVGPVEETLGVDESTSAEFLLADDFQRPGRYPVVIRTYYKDTGGHRFTALIVGFHDYQTTAVPDISIQGKTADLPVAGKGHVVFMLRNDGDAARTVDLALLFPDELSTPREHMVITVAPNEEKRIVFSVENYSALVNSRYPVTLVGRYDHDGHNIGMSGSATVHVRSNTQAITKPMWIWFVLGGFIPVVLVSLRVYARKMQLQNT